jgi:hypothetical protein
VRYSALGFLHKSDLYRCRLVRLKVLSAVGYYAKNDSRIIDSESAIDLQLTSKLNISKIKKAF